MVKKAFKWLREHYFLIINSIAFYPVIIAVCFLIAATGLIQLDFSDIGRDFKSNADWLSLKDSSTARTIIATVAAGIISLAVFSFSMVMILLNQAAVNMSNRILDSMIGNRFHQFILGFYIGTIVYAFFLLSTIRDVDSGLHIPSLSIYVLIIVTIFDIFLFIYFLHYITQSVKYETIINRLHETTHKALVDNCPHNKKPELPDLSDKAANHITLHAYKSGYFQGFAKRATIKFCVEHDMYVNFLYPDGYYVLKGTPLADIYSNEPLTNETREQFAQLVDVFDNQNNIIQNPYLGCKQLTEIAIKALSPGINDPGTAILALNRLGDLLNYRICHHPATTYEDEEEQVRIAMPTNTTGQYLKDCIYPIWDYGKEDRMIQDAMQRMLQQLIHDNPGHTLPAEKLLTIITRSIEHREI